MSKANGKDKEIPFYKKPSAYKKSGVMALIGCALMIASTILYWKILYVKTTETDFSGVNMFMVCFKIMKTSRSMPGIISTLLLFLFYTVVILLAVIGIKDNITRTDFLVKYKKRIRFSLVLGVIILMTLITHVGATGSSLDKVAGLRDNWVSFIKNCKESGVPGASSMSCVYMVGPGFICFIAGVVLYIASIVFSFMLDTLNED